MLDIWGRGLHICEVWVRHVGVRVKHLGGARVVHLWGEG